MSVSRHIGHLAKTLVSLTLLAAPIVVSAEETFDHWPILPERFESTGGGGVMIEEYRPAIKGAICMTDFVAVLSDGRRFENTVDFSASFVQGGILCDQGRWRSRDGKDSGTTPLRVFIKDGVVRGKV